MSWRSRQKGISVSEATTAVNEKAILLVYPMSNRPEVPSLWSYFYPKVKMRWVWDENGDDRVVKMWDLRERLSRTEGVVYSKWYQNRATFFSPQAFAALLAYLNHGNPSEPPLAGEERDLLAMLTENSPQSTKVLKKAVKAELKWEAPLYERHMKSLWQRGFIIGQGEIDDGAFPSLSVGATECLREDLWKMAHEKSALWVSQQIEKCFPQGSYWRKQLTRLETTPQRAKKTPASKKKKVLSYKDIKS